MSKSINDRVDQIMKFVEERDWQTENPGNLTTSALVELGELFEHYQWENKFPRWDDDKKKEVSYEFVDVLNYLFRLAARSEINIDKAYDEKMEKLKNKYPIGQTVDEVKKTQQEYRKSGKNKLYE